MNPARVTPRGFTLIELLTVIAIVGILAAIVVPVVGKVRESARNSLSVSNLRQLAQANILYAAENKGVSLLPTNNLPEHCYSWGAAPAGNVSYPWGSNRVFAELLNQQSGYDTGRVVTRSGHRPRLKNDGEQSIGMNWRARGEFYLSGDAARATQAIRLNLLTNASTLVLFGESDGQWIEPGTNTWTESMDTGGGYTNQLAFRNGKGKAHVSTYGGNVLLLDRSVLTNASERTRHFTARF
jgi:prepilin-type N-terminal cleavage/methylation domain-containing protein